MFLSRVRVLGDLGSGEDVPSAVMVCFLCACCVLTHAYRPSTRLPGGHQGWCTCQEIVAASMWDCLAGLRDEQIIFASASPLV
jgi:hypothetical protein